VRSVEALDGGGAVVEVQDISGALFRVRVKAALAVFFWPVSAR
jgi:hypothetical protein